MLSNPVLPGFNADPSFVRGLDEFGNTVYYIANSTFEYFPGVQIHRSYDLLNWELVARPLDSVELLDMKGDPDSGGIWAPDLSYADGKWWLIYTDVKVTEGSFKDCTNYLTTADSVFGPWSTPVKLTNSGFDASLFHDEDGKKYLVNMYWDPREYKHPFAGIQCTEYSVTEQRLLPETSRIIYHGTNVKLVEGPHLYKLKTPAGEFYYLFAAQGGTTYTHQEVVARAKTLDGVFETQPGGFEGEPFLTAYDTPFNYLQKCGHGALVEVGGASKTGDVTQNEWYFAHLTSRPVKNPLSSEIDPRGYCPLGRESAIQKVAWNQDGWPEIVGGKQGAQFVEVPELEVPAQVPNVHQGNREAYALPFDFQTLRIPFTSELGKYEKAESCAGGTAKNGQSDERDCFGELTLYGRESLLSLHTQAHVLRRWQSLNFEATVKVEYDPSTYQQSAGLSAYYNTQHWSALSITNRGNSLPGGLDNPSARMLQITKTDRGNQTSILSVNSITVLIPDGADVWLRLSVCDSTYYYSFSYDGYNFTILPFTGSTTELSDDYTLESYGGFFTGAFVGLFNVDGTGLGIPAKFSEFEYTELDDKPTELDD
ncbi:MAG: glycoside hydrolase family 43 protein [Candidatus Ancillula sp.]|nr:glycoside hydrolase family 43 protein [Candidatus Ancillula sp.]